MTWQHTTHITHTLFSSNTHTHTHVSPIALLLFCLSLQDYLFIVIILSKFCQRKSMTVIKTKVSSTRFDWSNDRCSFFFYWLRKEIIQLNYVINGCCSKPFVSTDLWVIALPSASTVHIHVQFQEEIKEEETFFSLLSIRCGNFVHNLC